MGTDDKKPGEQSKHVSQGSSVEKTTVDTNPLIAQARAEAFEAQLKTAVPTAPPGRRTLLIVGGAFAAVVVLLIILIASIGGTQLCGDARGRLAGVWDAPVKNRLQKAFAATGVPLADEVWTSYAGVIDRYAARWESTIRRACDPDRAAPPASESVLLSRLACLENRRAELGGLVAVSQAIDADGLDGVLRAALGLRPPQVCAQIFRAGSVTDAVPTGVARQQLSVLLVGVAKARSLRLLGKVDEAAAAAAALVAAAEPRTHLAVRAAALLEVGTAAAEHGDHRAAESALRRAALAADEVADDEMRIRALTELALVVGVGRQRPEDAGDILMQAAAALSRRGETGDLVSDLAYARGAVALAAADSKVATENFGRAMEIRRRLYGDKHPLVADCEIGLGEALLLQKNYGDAWQHFENAVALLESSLGSADASLAEPLMSLGKMSGFRGTFAAGQLAYERALGVQEISLEADDPVIASGLNDLAANLAAQGKHAEAIETAERAQTILEARGEAALWLYPYVLDTLAAAHLAAGDIDQAWNHLQRAKEILAGNAQRDQEMITYVAISEANVMAARGECERAAKVYAAQLPEMLASGVLDRSERARISAGAAKCYLGHGRSIEALELLRGAVDAIHGTDADPFRRASASFELAKALWDSGGDRVLALKMATSSRGIYAGLAGTATLQAVEVDAWLDAHTAH